MIELPEALKSYLADKEIFTAVSALTSGKQKLPDALKWSDLEAYYRAVAAAEQIKVDYAIASYRLWEAVWGRATESLGMLSPEQTLEFSGDANTPDACWNAGYHARCVKLNGKGHLWADLELSREYTELTFQIDGFTHAQLLKELPPTFGKHATANWVFVRGESLTAEEDPIPALQEAARHAVAVARKLVPAAG